MSIVGDVLNNEMRLHKWPHFAESATVGVTASSVPMAIAHTREILETRR